MTDLNSGKPWSEIDLIDLRNFIAWGDSIDEVALFLCREVEETLVKIRELGLSPVSRTSS